jgi:2-amino-4-hydroxy-6-hydroxymethyldihydropteridine diphosphokinase
MTRVYLSLGSNIDREHNIRSGLDALARHFGEVRLSPVYESAAVGFDGEPFLNLVAAVDTELTVAELATLLRGIEANHGRTRGEKKFASRTLDIDILTWGDAVGMVEGVELPRDEILKHAFVLRPLADIAPDERHPLLQKRYAELLAEKDFSSQSLWSVPFSWPDQ